MIYNMNIFDFVKKNKETKTRDNVLELRYEELVNFDLFSKYLINNIVLGGRYSILVRVSYSNDNSGEFIEYKMLGPQISIYADTELELENIICDVYNVILQRLEYSAENYNYNEHDIINIQLLIFSLGNKPTTKSTKLTGNYLGKQKDLVNISKISDSYKYTELINDPDNIGKVLRKYMSKGILQHVILSNGNTWDVTTILGKSKSELCNSETKFYEKTINNDNYILIVNEHFKHKVVNIFTLSGMFVNKIRYEYLTNKTYSRKIGNVTVYVGDKGIYKTEIGIKFPSVYPYKITEKKKNMINPDWKIGTMDLETYNYQDISKTYAIGFYTKNSINTFYIDNLLNSDELIMKCIDNMLVDKYNGYTFYIHNFQNFDVYFLFRILILYSNKYTCKPYFRDDGIIGMKISSKTTKKIYSIKIVDSRNFLKGSLDALCKSFDTPIKKSYFPYTFVNKNTLFYIGTKPKFSYYSNIDKDKSISMETYNNIPSEDWDLKKETIIYLENDLISLFNVMEQFINKVFINYNIHVTSSLTISSLSMDIFLRKFYKGDNIPLIKQKSVYSDIKSSYYGGVTEVYKPYGKNLYYYDVNSLYPYSALNYMPGRSCTYVDNINKPLEDLDDVFGFFYCKVKASDKYIGLLPHRSDEGLTMPVGNFEGWYFSEEIKFALENGYKIEVIKGYYFDRVVGIFDEYVRSLYKIKSSTKDTVERQIVKSLLNNLLGRFGLDINKYTTSLLSYDEFKSIIQTRKVKGVKFIEDKVLLSYEKEPNKNVCKSNFVDFKDVINTSIKDSDSKYIEENYHDVSVAISSCVTAYSRIYMSKIKLDIINKGGNIYYTDTDSIVTDIELGQNIVGNELGEFKLEHKVKEGYFISNKTYGILTDKNETIIKNKGIHKGELTYDKLESLYLGNEVESLRYETVKSFNKGSAVLFVKNPIVLQPNSYNKRVKIFNENKLWVDTKPINKGYHTQTIIESKSNIWKNIFLVLLLTFYSTAILFIPIYMLLPIILDNINSNLITTSTEVLTLQDLKLNIDIIHSPYKSLLWEYLKYNFLDKFNGKYDSNFDINNHLIIRDYINMKCYDLSNNYSYNVRILEKVLLHHINDISWENDILRNKNSLLQIELQNINIHRLETNCLLDTLIREVNILGASYK